MKSNYLLRNLLSVKQWQKQSWLPNSIWHDDKCMYDLVKLKWPIGV